MRLEHITLLSNDRDPSVTCLARVSRTTWRITVWKTCLEQKRRATSLASLFGWAGALGCLISTNCWNLWVPKIIIYCSVFSMTPIDLALVGWCLGPTWSPEPHRMVQLQPIFSAPKSTQKRPTSTWMMTTSRSFSWSVTKGCFWNCFVRASPLTCVFFYNCALNSAAKAGHILSHSDGNLHELIGDRQLFSNEMIPSYHWSFWKTISSNEAWKIWTDQNYTHKYITHVSFLTTPRTWLSM